MIIYIFMIIQINNIIIMFFLLRIIKFGFLKNTKNVGKMVTQPKVKSMSHIMINNQILRAQQINEMHQLLEQYGKAFNNVNISTFLKKLVDFKQDKDLLTKFNQFFNKNLYFYENIDEYKIQSIANSIFYLSKLKEENEMKDSLERINNLDYKTILEYSREQQLGMIINALSKLNMIHKLEPYLEKILQKMENSNISTQLRIWELLLKGKVNDRNFHEKYEKGINIKKVKFLEDYVYMLYCYAKADLPLSAQKLQQFVIYPPHLINMNIKLFIMLMTALWQLPRLHFEETFHSIIYIKIQEFINIMTLRELSHTVQGITALQVQKEDIIKLLEDKFIELIKNKDYQNQSITSIFYNFIELNKYSKELISVMQNLILNDLLKQNSSYKNLPTKHFQKLFYSFKAHKEHQKDYQLPQKLKMGFKKYIEFKQFEFKIDQILSIIYFSREFYECDQICPLSYQIVKEIQSRQIELDNSFLKKMKLQNCFSPYHNCTKFVYK